MYNYAYILYYISEVRLFQCIILKFDYEPHQGFFIKNDTEQTTVLVILLLYNIL